MAINWYTTLLIGERFEAIKTYDFSPKPNAFGKNQYSKHKKLYAPFFDGFISQKLHFEYNDKFTAQDLLKTYVPYLPPNSFSPKVDWLQRLTDAYTTFDTSHPKRVKCSNSNKTIQTFWSFFEPLLSAYALEIEQELAKLTIKNGFPLIETGGLMPFLEPAVEKISLMAERAFILELRVAKQAGELEEGTPTERFDHFFAQFKQTEQALAFFEIYPILGRMACAVCENWKNYFIEIISNIYEDLTEIKEKIPPLSKIHTLTAINALLTDGAQTGGRSVAILTFNDALKIVYKPRDSAIDIAYGQFLGWFNAENIVPPIRHATILSRQNHSWYEFIAPNEEMTYAQLPIMYNKLGALLCLMYLFDTIDMHTDNLIVVGDDPVLIDLETWLQPLLPDENRNRSVHQTHLLPKNVDFTPDSFDLEDLMEADLHNKTWTERKELVWENEGTDDMRIVRKRLPVDKNRNSISIGEHVVNPADYTRDIVKGFRKTYRHIAAHTTTFLEATQCFNDKKLRSILRGSKKYDALIEDMAHPSNLQDGIVLEQFLDRLWIDAADEPYLKSLINIEKKDLINLDNPYFYTYTDSTTLFYNEKPILEGFFGNSALAIMEQNIEQMSVGDLEKQVRIIRQSFAKLRLNYQETPKAPN